MRVVLAEGDVVGKARDHNNIARKAKRGFLN